MNASIIAFWIQEIDQGHITRLEIAGTVITGILALPQNAGTDLLERRDRPWQTNA